MSTIRRMFPKSFSEIRFKMNAPIHCKIDIETGFTHLPTRALNPDLILSAECTDQKAENFPLSPVPTFYLYLYVFLDTV